MGINKAQTIYRVENLLHIMTIIVSFFLIISISVDTFKNVAYQTQITYLKIQFWVCIFFLLEIFFEFLVAKNKFKYLYTHFIFILIAIPYLNIIDYYNLDLPTEVSYFIRFIPLLRGGYALSMVVSWFCKNKASSLFISYLTMLVASIYFSSLMFLFLEQNINPMVTSFGSSLWWACMTVTTVGSNIYAVTTGGKILSVVLAALGMMMFPIFTVYITSVVQKTNKKE